MWVFGQVWLLCLLAFVIGAVLDQLLFTRPLRKQVRQLEIQLAKAKRADALPPPPEIDVERTGIVDGHPPTSSPGWDPDRLPSWERDQEHDPVAEAPRTLIALTPEHDLGYDRPEPRYDAEPVIDQPYAPAEHDYQAEHDAEPAPEPTQVVEPEPVAEEEPEPSVPATAQVQAPEPPQPPADDRPTQVQAPIPAAPPIRNPSPAEMTAVINRIAGEANATETTSVLPAAIDDHEDMELADHGPASSQHGQLAHVPADDLEDENFVDDVVEEELTASEREAAAETTGPVAVSVIAAAEKVVQERRLAGALAQDEESEPPSRHSRVEEEPVRHDSVRHGLVEEQPADPEPADHSYAESAAQSFAPPARESEPPAHEPQAFAEESLPADHAFTPEPQPFEPIQAFEQPAPEPEPGQVQLEELSQPIRLDPNQFGKPIPPGALTPPGSVTPPEPAESASPLPTRPQPARPEPAPMEAVARSRSLFEPVLDPDGEDPYEDLDGFQPIQEPTTRSFSSTDSVPFTPILAPELLANEQPQPPVSTPAGLPKRTVSNSWPRGGNGLGAGPQPFDPAPFRPRQAFSPMPRNTDAAPIRRPSSGGPRTPFGPGSALPKPDGSAPSDDYQVKAMIGSRTYHPAGSGGFDAVRAEVWFRNSEEAERAGFSPAD
ncbi:sunset domain-containing protein [Kutzneria sp. CA-103260]|uniref:sunset domain-containing protein n=1 Tax=Kutzneria sp. CA-103260 TaxID=2802641 RepID=UPI003FA5C921